MDEAAPPNLAVLQGLHAAGYGFYRDLARVREDDLLVRSRAADALHRATAIVYLAEQRARRAMPAPTREQPVPDPAAMEGIRALKAVQGQLAALETKLRGPAALPDKDFSSVVPSEAVRLRLVSLDATLLETAQAIEAAAPSVDGLVTAMDSAITNRTAL